jgi:hypothetical protein
VLAEPGIRNTPAGLIQEFSSFTDIMTLKNTNGNYWRFHGLTHEHLTHAVMRVQDFSFRCQFSGYRKSDCSLAVSHGYECEAMHEKEAGLFISAI